MQYYQEGKNSQILENAEPSNFPFILCYMTRMDRSGTRAQRGAERKWSKSWFESIIQISEDVLYILIAPIPRTLPIHHQVFFGKFGILFQDKS